MIILVVAGLPVGPDFSALALSGLACLPLAVGTFVATNLAARRDSRAGTEELLATLPQPEGSPDDGTAGGRRRRGGSRPVCWL